MSSVFSIYVGKHSFLIDPNLTPLELSTRFCRQFHIDVAQQIQVQNTLKQIVEANQFKNRIQYQNYLENSQIQPQNRKYILSDFIGRNKSYEKGLQHKLKKENQIDYIRFSQDLLESENCTFKPTICKGNKKKNEENRFEILYNRGKHQMLRRNKSIDKPSKLDILDGNCTFKPIINNRSRVLWDKSNEQSNSTTSLTQCISQILKKSATCRVKLEELFDKLDSQKRGIISRDYIDLTDLVQNDIKELMPIFLEIDDQNLCFNREQFIDYVQNTKLFTQ